MSLFPQNVLRPAPDFEKDVPDTRKQAAPPRATARRREYLPTKDEGSPPDLQRQSRREPPKQSLDRLPPNSPESEVGVLGCCMISPRDCIGQCIETFPDGAEVFYDLKNQTIFRAMLEMYNAAGVIDVITLQQNLKDKQQLDQVGGIAYLSSLPDAVPSAANLQYYADIVQEKYLLRKMIRVCTDAIGRIYDFEGEVPKLLDEIERDILRVAESRAVKVITPIKELVSGTLQRFEQAQQRNGEINGIATGLTDLDRMLNGLKAADVFVIAARPSIGKTSLALNIAEYVTCTNKLPVGMFSLEMTAEALSDRLVASRARVNMRNIRNGYLAERDFPRISSAAGAIANAPLYIDDSPGLSILNLRARARRYWQQYGIKLFVIDYLQLMNATGGSRRSDSRQQEIADISMGVKSLAKELSVPVILLSQLNRELDKEKNRKPRLSDLRESGAIEQDADIVGLLYRPGRDSGDAEEFDASPTNLLIAKQRNGPTGDVSLVFIKSLTRFESVARETEDPYKPEATQQPLPTYQTE